MSYINYYEAVRYMCVYFSKSEVKCFAAMKQALDEARDLEASKLDTEKGRQSI